MSARVAVLCLPGVNGEDEAARACRRVGLAAELVPWTTEAAALARYDAYVLPGGFSYQDRVRAGAVGARHRLLDVVRRRAESGVPVLGICNGAQVLVESGLVPGTGGVELALAPNRMPDREGYHARWIWCRVAESRCLFTQAYAPGESFPMPVAHGEGRFLTSAPERWQEWRERGQLPLTYVAPAHEGTGGAPGFPWNPNGAQADAAGVCNARGNVLALMPHPERGEALAQVPLDLPGEWGERRRRCAAADLLGAAGPGRGLFLSLAAALGSSRRPSRRAEVLR